MIKEAVRFAVKAHKGAVRKGTDIPYIVHPLETAVIVSSLTKDEEVICAAVLHDVIEDTVITGDEIASKFGERVASLVRQETEDKSLSWQERKAATLEHLKSAEPEVKLIALGDKLSNIRSTAGDYLSMGDQLWDRFNEKDKAKHAWYYCGVAEAVKEFSDTLAYEEYMALCQMVFSEFL